MQKWKHPKVRRISGLKKGHFCTDKMKIQARMKRVEGKQGAENEKYGGNFRFGRSRNGAKIYWFFRVTTYLSSAEELTNTHLSHSHWISHCVHWFGEILSTCLLHVWTYVFLILRSRNKTSNNSILQVLEKILILWVHLLQAMNLSSHDGYHWFGCPTHWMQLPINKQQMWYLQQLFPFNYNK